MGGKLSARPFGRCGSKGRPRGLETSGLEGDPSVFGLVGKNCVRRPVARCPPPNPSPHVVSGRWPVQALECV